WRLATVDENSTPGHGQRVAQDRTTPLTSQLTAPEFHDHGDQPTRRIARKRSPDLGLQRLAQGSG
ncbi:MAG TPA: hypothetical protein VHK24_07705, partial [Steroidobacter sp.]|nr:hypothetical protein [Steroidobacter sp.]